MANTKVTGDLIASSTIATGNIADNAVTSDKISGITTAHITEGSNLYYTDARADARITAATTSDLTEGTNLYYTNARTDARVNLQTGANLSLSNKSTSDLSEGTNLYYTDARADARAALLVDSAPSTLDTLNELAAALGDDPNFATTTANSIGLKAPLASPSFTGIITANSSSSGDYVRLYGSSGTGKWDIYGNGANLRISDNESAGILAVDRGATFGGNVDVTGSIIARVNASYYSTKNYLGDTWEFASDTADGVTFKITGGAANTTGNFFKFQTQAGGATAATALTINKDLSSTFAGEIRTANRLAIKETYFGYSSGYKVIQVGESAAAKSISLGYDPSGNTSGSFSGNEILIPNNIRILAPAANNSGYYGLMMLNSSNKVLLGSSNYLMESNYIMALDPATKNVGIGVTPNAPANGLIQLDIGDNGCGMTSRQNNELILQANANYSTYAQVGKPATRLNLTNSGEFHFLNAPAGTAIGDTISFTERMRINSSGRVGIAITPSAWGVDALQVGQASISQDVNSVYIGANTYNSSAGWKRINAQLAGYMRMGTNDGIWSFSNGVTGAANSVITWNERMRITSGGQVNITGVANGNNLEIAGGFSGRGLMISTAVGGGAASGKVVYNAQTSTNKGEHDFKSDGRSAFIIGNNLVCSGDLNDTSDVSKKTNIQNLIGGLDVVSQLRPVNYEWKEQEGRNSGIKDGFIAQEVETIMPNVVVGEEGNKAINVTGLVAHLTKAIQELKADNDSLKARIETLEN